MTREERFLDWGSFIFVILAFGYTILHDNGVLPSYLEPYSLLITIILFISAVIVIAYLIVRKETKKKTIGNPVFANLTIHLSHKDDTPDTELPSNPRFVSYKTEAYWVNDEIELHFRQHEIAHWYSYDGEKKLRKSLDAQGIHINDRDIKSAEEIGLWNKPNGELMLASISIEPNDVLKLKELRKNGKFNHLELAVIYPWYCVIRRFMNKKYPSDKAVIIDRSQKPKVARPVPTEWIQFYHQQLIYFQSYSVPFPPLKWFCLIWRCKFNDQQWELSHLLSMDESSNTEPTTQS